MEHALRSPILIPTPFSYRSISTPPTAAALVGRRRGYYVLRKTTVPAVLVECGFLTNPTEAAYAQTASYRQKLAEEIAAGVRGRNAVGSALTTTRVATSESIPLQPYIDQTKVAKSERHRSKRSHKKSVRRKKKSSKPGSEAKAASKDQEG
ncbi:MAG: hypothetical protein DMF20_00145 [Verrucomicrobia bacterium]|nr:MAG: hypothetical protein DMF20_00145 [Verrucomicrobiota bacterium]